MVAPNGVLVPRYATRAASFAQHTVLLWGLVGAETRCTPTAAPLALPPVAPTPPVKTERISPTWYARFAKPVGLAQCSRLAEATRLCVGALGERWLDQPSGATASPYLADEDLVAALPLAERAWIFVGRHGTRYTSESPLGPFTSLRRASREFEEFTVQPAQWFGITRAGELFHGSLTDIEGTRAPLTDRVFGLAMTPSGIGVTVGYPERLWLTRDSGAHWQPLAAGPFGTRSVSVDDQGAFTLSTLLKAGNITVDGITVKTTTAATLAKAELSTAPSPNLQTQGFTQGRSISLGNEFVELRNVDGRWYVVRGPLEGPFTVTPVQGLEDCVNVRLSAFGKTSLVIGQKQPPKTGIEPLSAFASDDRLEQFHAVTTPILGQFESVRLAALGPNRFLATGVCSAERAPRTERHRVLPSVKSPLSCRPTAPLLLRIDPASAGVPASLSATPVIATDARVTAPCVAASADGTRAAFVARDSKLSPWHVYVSTDAGSSFVAHSIDDSPTTETPARPSRPRRAWRSVNETRDILSLRFSDDRSLSLVYRNGDAPVIANFDARGNLVATAMTPPGTSRADAVGVRILAFSRVEGNVYESLDRGASFDLVAHLPGPACLSWLECNVSCTLKGCLIGERFTRSGWGGRGAHPLDIAGNPEVRINGDNPTDLVSFRTPLSCQARAVGKPTLTVMPFAPQPDQVSLFDSLWLSPWQDWEKASAGAYRVTRSSRSIEKTTALQPIPHPERAGLALGFNEAGLAFLRAEALPQVGEPTGEFELAWMPSARRTWHKARFRDAATLKSGDTYLFGAKKARKLLPEVLAVSNDDAFVQVHADDDHERTTHFASANKVTDLSKIPWPFPIVRRPQWQRNGSGWVVYAFDDTGAQLLRASASASIPDKAWTFAAQTITEPFGARGAIRDRVQPHFADAKPYLILSFAARGRQLQSLHAYELNTERDPLGAGVALALPSALSEPPPACSARDRQELRRAVVPLLPAAARALGFTDDKGQTHWLVVSHAVLYASEGRACIDALWAETLPGMTPIRAVVDLGDLPHSWVFRSQRVNGESQVGAQTVQCHFDAQAKVPPEFETRTQARFNLEHLPLE